MDELIEKPLPKLNKKRKILLDAKLKGMSNEEALVKAGYGPNSTNLIATVIKPRIDRMIEEQTRSAQTIMTKDEIIVELKKIALNSTTERNRIMAMQQICKMLGFEAPTKIDQSNTQELLMKIELDHSTEQLPNAN